MRFGLYSSSVGNETVRLTQWLAFRQSYGSGWSKERIEMSTQGSHSETEQCYALLTKIERTVEVTLHLPAAVLGASHVHEKMQGCKAHE